MWGGITTPGELRAIADAAEKYNVPTVKVTGGQRLDLAGRQGRGPARDLEADLNAAGLVSGHAYSKGLRTVKTCVGTDHCRFGTQDSAPGLGIKLEKGPLGLLDAAQGQDRRSPAVPGTAPRRRARMSASICVDSGYQVGVAGAAGMDVKETERLAECRDRGGGHRPGRAFVQLYRENAKYLGPAL